MEGRIQPAGLVFATCDLGGRGQCPQLKSQALLVTAQTLTAHRLKVVTVEDAQVVTVEDEQATVHVLQKN